MQQATRLHSARTGDSVSAVPRQLLISEVQPGDVLLRTCAGVLCEPRDEDRVVRVDGAGSLFIVDFADGKSSAPLGLGFVWVAREPATDVTEGDEYAKLAVEGRREVRKVYADSRAALGLTDDAEYRSDCTGRAQR